MYCTKCGNKLEPSYKYCTKCGIKLNDNQDNNTLKIISIILGISSIIFSFTLFFGFVLSIVGFILSIVSKKYVKNELGIVLNIIGFTLTLIITIILILLVLNVIKNEYGYEYYPNENENWDYVIPFDESDDLRFY